MPTPVMYNVAPALLMVNALAPELNTIPFTCVRAEVKTPVTLEVAKVATSAAPFGGPPAVQLAAVFQSPLTWFIRHVALSAKMLLAVESRSSSNIATTTNNDGNRGPGRGDGAASDIDEER